MQEIGISDHAFFIAARRPELVKKKKNKDLLSLLNLKKIAFN
jgi:hypothetical protein